MQKKKTKGLQRGCKDDVIMVNIAEEYKYIYDAEKNPPYPFLQPSPLHVSGIKVNPGVSDQQLEVFQSKLLLRLYHWSLQSRCKHHWCLPIIFVFLVESESGQTWVAEQQLQHLKVLTTCRPSIDPIKVATAQCPMHCTPTTIVHNVHIYVWNIKQKFQRLNIVFPHCTMRLSRFLKWKVLKCKGLVLFKSLKYTNI